MNNSTPTPSHAELLALWERDSDLARSMNVTYTCARQWKERGRLPPEHWTDFIAQLDALFGRTVTYEQLTLAYKEARQAKRQEMAEAGPPGGDAA